MCIRDRRNTAPGALRAVRRAASAAALAARPRLPRPARRHTPAAYNEFIMSMPLSAGTRLGCYEILSQIGAGGMAEVYRARDARLGRDVALKVLPSEFAADPDRLRRFELEARAVAGLSHPNV